MLLGDHLKLAAETPWEWGVSDCSTFPADWILDQTGRDPMAEWRGLYGCEFEVYRLIAEAGGLVNLFSRGIDPIWPRAKEVSEGAVGVVSLNGEDGVRIDLGAIHTGKRWAIRSPRGLAMITEPLAVRRIWAR